jgi:hypothetical protein
MKGNRALIVVSALAGVGAFGPPSIGCSTPSPAGQGADAATDSSSTSGSDGSGSVSSSGGGSSSGSSGSGGSGSSGGSGLRWYSTCGDPVCYSTLPDAGGLTDDAGAPCPAIGSTCSVNGAHCGTSNPYFNCGATEACAASDPTSAPAACPMH